MVKNTRRVQRGEESLSRERIIDTAIALLDSGGTDGLTFRALAERLGTGPGAIYWHVADKDDLLSAACDSVMAGALRALPHSGTPAAALLAIGLGLFDAIDAHPWAGIELTRAAWRMPMVRVLEAIGRQVEAMDLPAAARQPATFILLNYIVGVARQNAANAQTALREGHERTQFLDSVANAWAALDESAFPFVRGLANHLRTHDDRAEFVAGLELILAGLRGGRTS